VSNRVRIGTAPPLGETVALDERGGGADQILRRISRHGVDFDLTLGVRDRRAGAAPFPARLAEANAMLALGLGRYPDRLHHQGAMKSAVLKRCYRLPSDSNLDCLPRQ
jgi:hypothetical protein